MTRKFTEREIREFARVGFTTEDTEGTKDFLGWRASVGHGMTRKFTEREDRRIGARGLTRRREGHEGFFGLARVRGPRNDTEVHGNGK
jgi:hypothetical protein